MLFDYWMDSVPNTESGYVHDVLLKRPLPLYVFVSHFHTDHFNTAIFDFQAENPDIHFIISKDIKKHRNNKLKGRTGDILIINKGESFQDEHVLVRAFESTDSGVCYAVECEGKKLFHAGDFNDWDWSGTAFGTAFDTGNSQALHQKFLSVLNEIKTEFPVFDVAMFPVDPHMEKKAINGPCEFLKAVKTRYFCPMHFLNDFKTWEPLSEPAASLGSCVLEVRSRGQVFEIA